MYFKATFNRRWMKYTYILTARVRVRKAKLTLREQKLWTEDNE